MGHTLRCSQLNEAEIDHTLPSHARRVILAKAGLQLPLSRESTPPALDERFGVQNVLLYGTQSTVKIDTYSFHHQFLTTPYSTNTFHHILYPSAQTQCDCMPNFMKKTRE